MKIWFFGKVIAFLIALTCQPITADPIELEYKHGISLIHEQKYPPDFTHFDYLNPNAPRGGRLVMSTNLEVNNFSGEWDNSVDVAPWMENTYDTLLDRAYDELSGYYGRLANGVAVAKDLRSIAFRLHSNARWHDGSPITAHDVKFTWDYAKTTIDGTLFMSWMGDVEILSEREVLIRLNEQLTNANLALFTYVEILSRQYWKGKDPKQTTLVPPLGSGPYRVADFRQGRFVRFERVRDYWGKDLPVNRGRWNFDEIQFDVYRDSTVAREAMRKGLFDAYIEADVRHWVSSYNVPARDKGWLIKTRVANGVLIGPAAVIAFNARRAPFSDPRVREALFLAMDYNWVNRVINHDQYEQASSYYANSVFASNGLPDEAELVLLAPHRDQIPPRVFSTRYELPDSTGFGRNRQSLLKARQLLADAGWREREGVLVDANGQPFELEFISQYQSEKRILLPYIASLQKLGIDARIRLVESAQLIYKRRSYDFDALIHGVQMTIPPDLNNAYYFHSNAANSPITGNAAGIINPAVDDLISRGMAATSLEEMIAATRALDRVLLWNFYTVPLAAYSPLRVAHWDKFGRPDLGMDHLMQSVFPSGWWYDERKASRIPSAK